MPKSSQHDAVYELDPHSIVKHEILEAYLKPWFPILSKYNETVQYFDCFAGSGEFQNPDIRGSPIIALDCLQKHILAERMSKTKFNMVFIEADEERASILQKNIDSREFPKNVQTHIVNDDFKKLMDDFFGSEDSPKDVTLVPTFAFIDPFGYKMIPMIHTRRILETPKCEVMINLMVDNAKRNAFADKKGNINFEKGLDALFGCHDWIGVYDIPEERKGERNEFMADLYVRELTKNLSDEFKFTLQFKMINKVGHESYRLVFATKNALGLKLMKEAMWKADRRGMYTFDDRMSGQSFLVDFANEKQWVADAAKHLSEHFKGQTKLREEIEKYVIEETGWIFRTSILKKLEADKTISVEGRKKVNTHPEGCKITFKAQSKRTVTLDLLEIQS